MKLQSLIIFCLLIVLSCAISCKHKPPNYGINPSDTNLYGHFPNDVGKIIVERCATAGCHNAQSYSNAAGLLLDSWEHLFDGSNSGAVVVPYNIQNSSLLFFINPDSNLGPRAQPQMPLNAAPLTNEEYKQIRDWIANGAPDANGNIPFASNAGARNKIYLTNQGCDLISVIDAEKRVTMRYIKVGKDAGIEAPQYLRIASDGYAYVSFIGGRYLQKIDTRTDQVVGDVEVGSGSWNVFHISQDGKQLLLGDYSGAGGLVFINTETMQLKQRIRGIGMSFPHGITSNAAFDTFFITSQIGNTIYKFSLTGSLFEKISIDEKPPTTLLSKNPHEILMSPDFSKYFITCDKTNEIRIMNTTTDKLIDSIPLGFLPQEMAISKSKPYLFVTCTEDNSLLTGFKGSVYVINYNTHKVVHRIDGPFYQPHAITVDDVNGIVYIANRNISSAGPAPHHTSSCGGRNGYYVLYDLNTFQKLPNRYEVSVDPYSSDIRFK